MVNHISTCQSRTGAFVNHSCLRQTIALSTRIAAALGLTCLLAVTSSAQPADAAAKSAVVVGKVTSGGIPVTGAKVTLYACPRQAVVATLKPRTPVPMRVIGSAESASNGEYVISVSNWRAVQASADGNIVNLEVIAVQGKSGGEFSFPRLLVSTSTGPALAVDDDAAGPNMAPQQATLSLTHGLPTSRHGQDPPNPPPCGQMRKVKYLGKRWVVVGLTSSKVTGVTMHFVYGKDQSSTLGVGFSVTGGKGSYKLDGHRAVTESGSAGFPFQKNKITALYKTKFTYWKFLVVCIGYKVSPTKWDAGTEIGHEGVPKATHCVGFAAGSTFAKDTTTAWTFSAGVDLGTVIALNLSVQTGYDTTASLNYTVANHTFLCGKNDSPGGTPGLVVAGLPSHG